MSHRRCELLCDMSVASASWGLLGGLSGVMEVDLKFNIILEGLNFAERPS